MGSRIKVSRQTVYAAAKFNNHSRSRCCKPSYFSVCPTSGSASLFNSSSLLRFRVTGAWCAAPPGVKTTPPATCSRAASTGRPSAGTSTSPLCCRRNDPLLLCNLGAIRLAKFVFQTLITCGLKGGKS